MLAKVDQTGRCDLHVPFYWFERLRFNFGEMWLVVAFCVGALNAQDPYGVSRWLNWWSLCACPLPLCVCAAIRSYSTCCVVLCQTASAFTGCGTWCSRFPTGMHLRSRTWVCSTSFTGGILRRAVQAHPKLTPRARWGASTNRCRRIRPRRRLLILLRAQVTHRSPQPTVMACLRPGGSDD